MGDLKLIGRSAEELTNEIQIVKTITNDTKMKRGLEKCAKNLFKKWQGS
jgi:hypothetical protein